MRSLAAPIVVVAVGLSAVLAASPQNPPAAAAAARTDIYHVHFTKAVPGQAAALGKALAVPDQTAPMPDHFVVLRHQEGDDWDYAVIQHVGQKATFDAAAARPNPARDMRAWHNDTFVSGPSWADFSRAMGLDQATAGGGMVYALATHRAVPGHRDQLEKALSQPAPGSSKIQTGNVFMQHLEGGDWTFLTITRYNSWQDFAADRASADPSAAGGWSDIRQHADFHRDTIADRIFPVK
jgi:hypothetical protein